MTNDIPHADFDAAMRLLGLDIDDPDKALVSVYIEAGRVTGTYSQIGKVADAPRTQKTAHVAAPLLVYPPHSEA